MELSPEQKHWQVPLKKKKQKTFLLPSGPSTGEDHFCHSPSAEIMPCAPTWHIPEDLPCPSHLPQLAPPKQLLSRSTNRHCCLTLAPLQRASCSRGPVPHTSKPTIAHLGLKATSELKIHTESEGMGEDILRKWEQKERWTINTYIR